MIVGGAEDAKVRLRLLGGGDAPDLQAVFERAGDYFVRVTGSAAPAVDAAERELGSVASTPGREVALIVVGGDPSHPDPAGASAAGRPVGAIGWWVGHPQPDIALLGMLMVGREDRGRGFARAALQRLEALLGGSGVARLRTAISAGDAESRRFVESLGFGSMDQRARVDVDRGRMRIAFYEKQL